MYIIPGKVSSPDERSKAERTYKEEKKERIMKNKNEPTSDSRRSIQIQAKDPRRKEPTNKCIKK